MGKQNLNKIDPQTPALAPEAAPLVWVALTGINYGCTDDDPAGTRVEAGEEVPAFVIEQSPWLTEQQLVAPKEPE